MLKRIVILFLLVLSGVGYAQAQVIDTVCASNKGEVYRVIPNQGSLYFWQVECGAIVSSSYSDSIIVDWCGKEGIYEIRVVEVTKYGCPADTVKAKVLVIDGVTVAIEGPTDICRGDYIQLKARGASTYIWNDGTRGPLFFTQPTGNTRYWVVGFNGKCVPDTAYWDVRVHEPPIADFSFSPQKPAVNENIRFQYKGVNGDQWFWYFDDRKERGSDVDFEYSYNSAGKKKVSLHVMNRAGCEDTITYWLTVNNESHLYAPTVFTPNDDRQNDEFKPVTYNIADLKFQIYNRWGELLYEGFGLDAAWDGTYKGKIVQEGVYLFQIQAKGYDNRAMYLDGTVTLLR